MRIGCHTSGMILSMQQARQSRKLRRTFTLSPQSLDYLEHETHRRGADSQSAVLDEVLREKNHEQQLKDYEAQVTAYYDNLTDEEREEQRGWAQLAEQTLVLTEEELAHAQSTARRNLVHKASNGPTGKRKPSGNHRVSRPQKSTSAR